MPKARASIAIYVMLTICSCPLRPFPNRVSFTAFAGKACAGRLHHVCLPPFLLHLHIGQSVFLVKVAAPLQAHYFMRKSGASAIAWQLRSVRVITSMLRASTTTRLGRSVAETTVLTFLISPFHPPGNRAHPN